MSARPDRYPVLFCEHGLPPTCGSLELADDRLLLAGGSARRKVELAIPFADVVEIQVGRHRSERLNGFATLRIERNTPPAVQIALLGASLLHEITDLLTTLTPGRRPEGEQLALIVPLRPGCLDRVRRLLELGPPIDPATLGLTSHQVYLRPEAALFVFSGPDVHTRVRRAAYSPALWRAGVAWRECLAAQPRIDANPRTAAAKGALAYTWHAGQTRDQPPHRRPRHPQT